MEFYVFTREARKRLDFTAFEASKRVDREPRFFLVCLENAGFTVFGNCECRISQEKLTFGKDDSLKCHI